MSQRKKHPAYLAGLAACTLGVLALGIALAKGAIAHFQPPETIAYVSIDGNDFGRLGRLASLSEIAASEDGSRTTIKLARSFVTEPSLFLWARRQAERRDTLQDITLTLKNREGYPISEYRLKSCKPLSWTVEAADPTQGGFRERVSVAVQEIAVY